MSVPTLIVRALRSILAHPKNPEALNHARRVIDYYDAAPSTQGDTSMSLEAAVHENTAAIHALIAQLATGKVPAAVAPEAKPAAPAPAVETAAPATTAQAAAPAAAAPAATAPTVAACSKGTLELAASHGRDAAVSLLSKFGVKKASDLKPEQVNDFWNELQIEGAKPKIAAAKAA